MARRAIARSRIVYAARPRTHRKAGPSISLAMLAGFAPTAAFAYEGFKIGGDQGGITEAAHRVTMRLTGYEWKGGGFHSSELTKGWLPLILGAMCHMGAQKLGINRHLRKATMGFISI
ncbi:MAG: hypothetical protein MUP14_05425 [Dehalococcoidia bacterium]|nr:hypothetical protein [Dehalococcoidia bacterium]